MTASAHSSTSVALYLFALAWLSSCSDPFSFDPSPVSSPNAAIPAEEVCAASEEWLPHTPAVADSEGLFKPIAHPAGECPFYRAAWQNFLGATERDGAGEPAFKSYPTIDGLFQSATPHPPPGPDRSWLGWVKQAGERRWMLLDQSGHLVYYGIHVNQAYADFIHANHLETGKAIQNADERLFFPAGVVELKSAWQRVEAGDPSLSDFITTKAWVPRVSQVNGQFVEDRNHPVEITVRLLALHVVFTLVGHPEFVWATFEHSAGTPDLTTEDGKRDVAPVDPRKMNPTDDDPKNQLDSTIVSPHDHLLYKGGTPLNGGNRTHPETELAFDEATQTFPGQQSSIYRMFPASKSNTTHPEDAVTSLNFNIEAIWKKVQARLQFDSTDNRRNYRLVGAVWLDKPAYFENDRSLQNDSNSPFARDPDFAADLAKNGSDSPFSLLAGEDRLSSTAMETFTQAPGSFNNCFACHNTQATMASGVPFEHDKAGVKLLGPKLLNVSHVLSQFVLEECGDNLVRNADGSTSVACP